MILKMQRALEPPDGPILVYNRSRKYNATLPMSPEFEAMFGDRVKIYVEAEQQGEDLHITDIVADQDW
jgi:hypothetical protein